MNSKNRIKGYEFEELKKGFPNSLTSIKDMDVVSHFVGAAVATKDINKLSALDDITSVAPTLSHDFGGPTL